MLPPANVPTSVRVVSHCGFDADVLRRDDGTTPRCVVPRRQRFDRGFDEAALRAAIVASNGDPIPRPLTLRVRLPCAVGVCAHCGSARSVLRDTARCDAYLTRLQRELEHIAPWFDRDRAVVCLHVGGGMPNGAGATPVVGLVDAIARSLRLDAGPTRDVAIDIDARHTSLSDLATLSQVGFNRFRIGLRLGDGTHARRERDVTAVLERIAAARRAGACVVTLDLAYGLPGSNDACVQRMLAALLDVVPDRITLHRDALAQMRDPHEAADVRAMLAHAIDAILAAGYRPLGVDRFVRPTDTLVHARTRGALQHDGADITMHDTDVVGIGVGATSRIGDTCSENVRHPRAWERALDAGRLPLRHGYVLDAHERLHADVARHLLCHGRVARRELARSHATEAMAVFDAALPRLAWLRDAALIDIAFGDIIVTARGIWQLPTIADGIGRAIEDARADDRQPTATRLPRPI